MQRIHSLLLALLLAGAALAGCVGEPEQTTDDGLDGDAAETNMTRTLIADLPEGTTEVEVEVWAWDLAPDNTTRVLVVVENDTREVLAQETFDVADETTRLLRVDPNGTESVHVTVRVMEGAADLEVEVRAVTGDAEPVVIVHERVEFHEAPDEDAGASDGNGDADPSTDSGDGDATNGDATDDGTGDGSGADDGTTGGTDDGAGNTTDDANGTGDGNTTGDGSTNETGDNETQP